MFKFKSHQIVLVTSMALFATLGCNVGMAPGVQSSAEVEQNFKELDPQAQIKVIQSSPAPADRKAELIKAIEDKYHVKAGEAPVQAGAQPSK